MSRQYLEQANKHYNEADYIKALDLYKKSLEENEIVYDKSIQLYNIGVCYLKLKDYEKSIEYLKEAVKENNRDSRYFFNIGYAYSLLNNAKESYRHFNIAWALNNNDIDCEKAIKLLEAKILI